MRSTAVAIVYLLFAFTVERGVLPQIIALMPQKWAALFDFRLMAMAGVLLGLIRGELAGLAVAVCAAFLWGLSQTPGYLGAALVSFAIAAAAGGLLSRHFRFQSAGFATFWLCLLLFAERLIWMAVRWFFFRNAPAAIGWVNLAALLLTAVFGGMLVSLVAPRMKRSMFIQS
jgi:hypothetical protein